LSGDVQLAESTERSTTSFRCRRRDWALDLVTWYTALVWFSRRLTSACRQIRQ